MASDKSEKKSSKKRKQNAQSLTTNQDDKPTKKSKASKSPQAKTPKSDVKLKSDYIGVVYHKNSGRWRARYNQNTGKRVWVKKNFATPEQAARAHDKAVLVDGVPDQRLNFPDAKGTPAKQPVTPKTTSMATPKQATIQTPVVTPVAQLLNTNNMSDSLQISIFVLEKEKEVAVQTENYTLAQTLKDRISTLKQQLEAFGQTPHAVTPMKMQTPTQFATPSSVPQQQSSVYATPITPQQPKKVASKQIKSTTKKTTPKKIVTEVPAVEPTPRKKCIGGPISRILSQLHIACSEHPNFDTAYGKLAKKAKDNVEWKTTKTTATKVSPRLFALDCEMVMGTVSRKKQKSSPGDYTESETDDDSSDDDTGVEASATQILARVSLVECKFKDKDGGAKPSKCKTKVLIDEYVKPPSNMCISDYLTHVSGVTKEHLDEASNTLQVIREKVLTHITEDDYIVGHSLQADLTALKLWHTNVLDTALLFGVKNRPSITLSLKDVAEAVHAYNEKSDLDNFQKKGESHDSAVDAEWSARVLVNLVHMQNENSSAALENIPHLLDDLPNRFKCRLGIYNIPPGYKLKHVARLFKSSYSDLSSKEIIKKLGLSPLKWTTRRTGNRVGSTSMELKTPQKAEKLFKKVETDSEVCHIDGYPDANGFQRKLVSLDKSEPKDSMCDLGSYFQMEELAEEPTRTLHVKSTALGKVIGPGGKRIIEIQRRTGCQIVTERQEPSELKESAPSVVLKNGRQVALHIRTDSEVKALKALKMMHLALKGNELGVANPPNTPKKQKCEEIARKKCIGKT